MTVIERQFQKAAAPPVAPVPGRFRAPPVDTGASTSFPPIPPLPPPRPALALDMSWLALLDQEAIIVTQRRVSIFMGDSLLYKNNSVILMVEFFIFFTNGIETSHWTTSPWSQGRAAASRSQTAPPWSHLQRGDIDIYNFCPSYEDWAPIVFSIFVLVGNKASNAALWFLSSFSLF